MALFESRETKELRIENKVLREEAHKLYREKIELKRKYYNTVAGELEQKNADDLDLTPTQRSKLGLIFSIERCRAIGVPEDRIIHNIEEADKFFTSEES